MLPDRFFLRFFRLGTRLITRGSKLQVLYLTSAAHHSPLWSRRPKVSVKLAGSQGLWRPWRGDSFFNGERVLHLQGHLTMAESRMVPIQWGIPANRYLLLECELAVLPCWFPRVSRTLLTSTRCTSQSLIIAAGLRDADRSPLGFVRLSKGSKCW